ncbi:hypothetical protein FOA43_004563 [Brettanomyces nanus]|uniref:Uncharacterized protein n=1 Tax=Eeniella nana TaxID=13502 RepID=A0A875S8A5_EENNA|nr:uncharacterized protein FOA43_004563 [Brettanomyces nanus]QPG77158.1 hypothetical protein FOA43_004563 [Brettanomyces nanus]
MENVLGSLPLTAPPLPSATIEIPDLNTSLPQLQRQQQHPQQQSSQPPSTKEISHTRSPKNLDDAYGSQLMEFKLGTPVSRSNDYRDSRSIDGSTSSSDLSIPPLNSATRPPPSYTLNIMVRQFTKYAERKLNLCLNSVPLDREPNIVEMLSEGVDPTFDRTVASLGYIARCSRRRVTDAVMHWRRGKSELREMARSILEKDVLLYREAVTAQKKGQSSNSVSSVHTGHDSGSSVDQLLQKAQKSEITFTQADRQLSISTFILWRVLIEVVRQSPAASPEDAGLEEIMYNYMRNMDPYVVSQSLIHSANWNLLAELLGEMSERSFLSVSDRFIADLEKFPTGYTDSSVVSEPSLSLLIHGMRYLQLSNTSLERFEEGADFLKSLAKFFYRCENDTISLSYCEVLAQLILNLAGSLTAEVNHPTWIDATKIIYTKALKIANRQPAKSWNSAIILVVASLCVFPKEAFDRQWMSVAEMLIRRLKPKLDIDEKITIVICISRLIWAYLFRYSDTLNAKTRNMELLASLLFPTHHSKRQQWLTNDPILIQSTVQILRAMAYSQLNFTLENVLLPVLKSGYSGVNAEIVSSERVTLCIRSYSCILWDYQHAEQPPFPTDDVIHSSLDPLEFSNDSGSMEVFEKTSSNAAVHTEVSMIIQNLLFVLEVSVGCKFLEEAPTSQTYAQNTPNPVRTPSLQSRLSSSFFHTDQKHFHSMDLFATALSSVTWCADVGNATNYRRIVELMVKNVVHSEATIAEYCVDALKLLISKKNPNIITTTFTTVAFFLDEKTASYLNHEYLSSDSYIRLLEVYVDVLQSWLESLTDAPESSETEPTAMYNVNHGFVQDEPHETKRLESLELKNIVNIIDEVEGNALFFFFNHDSRVRFLGAEILRMVTQFDEVLYDLTGEDNAATDTSSHQGPSHSRVPSKFVAEFGTRVIQILEGLDFFEYISAKKHLLSEAERKRYARLQRQGRKDTVLRVAESPHGVDAALWFKIFEDVLEQLVLRCPIQIAIARSLSCIRLVQLYDGIVAISNGRGVGNNSSLIWDYMLYLKIACCSLTTTSEQRLHVPQKTHSRKKSQQMFTVQHQKITSARSIFRITVPLLTTSNARLKDALVEGLSCLNVNIFKSFMQSVDIALSGELPTPARPVQRNAVSTTTANGSASHVRSISYTSKLHPTLTLNSSSTASSSSSSPSSLVDSRLTTEICCILNKVIVNFTRHNEDFLDEWILSKLQSLLINVQAVLLMSSSQSSYKYQRLRKYFCGLLESLHRELLKRDQVAEWIPFSFRKQAFEFMMQWCGYGRDAGLFQQRYKSMKIDIGDAVTLQASLELQKHQMQYGAISCMASLCASPTVSDDDSFDFSCLLEWTDALFNTRNERISSLARSAVLDILTVNSVPIDVLNRVIKRCYVDDLSLGNYFVTLKDAFVKGIKYDYAAYKPLALALFASGSDNYNVRAAASALIEFTEMKFYGSDLSLPYVDGICCRSRIIYKRTLFELSTHFATHHPEEKFMMISELTMLFHLVGSGPRRDIIAVLLPWVQTVELNLTKESSQNGQEADVARDSSLMVLYNFFEITLKYSHRIQNEVEALWVALGSGLDGSSAKQIFNFVVENSLALKNLAFVECSRQVVVSLSTIPGFNVVEALLSHLEPKSMIPTTKTTPSLFVSGGNNAMFPSFPYIADLSKVLESSSVSLPAFSLGELDVVFLVDLILSPNDIVKERLPLLLHLSFVLLDHQLSLVQDQACALLIHLIHQYGNSKSEKSKSIIASLRSPDYSKHIWKYRDLVGDKAGRIPDSMDTLIRDVLSIFVEIVPSIQKDWSRTAIEWATSCKVMHIASRSFQVFRCLISFLDQGMLRDMLSCLANTISDENLGIQSFAMQILMTLNAITAELRSEQLIDFPQLFWSSVASLSTIHEHEFIEVLSALSKFISKIDLDSGDTVQCLISTFPSKWEGRFEGLQKTVMIGLRSANAYEPSLKLLCRLDLLKDSEIIGSGSERVLMALLANLPRLLHAQSTHRFPEDLVNSANVIAEMAERNELPGLSRIITSLVKKRFRNKEDFLSQIVDVLKRHFFPTYSAETLVFFLGLLFNRIPWIKTETMDLLKHVFRAVDLTSDEFVGLGADLVAPLLRLLMTDYVDQALEVLDEATEISASPFDKHYLMMSAGDATMRKEYEKIATLFGIPDESGWSVPMPAISTARTRNNIHSVYSTCVEPSNDEEERVATVVSTVDIANPPLSDGKATEQVIESISANENVLPLSETNLDLASLSSLEPSISIPSSYVQYNPLSPEIQQQLNSQKLPSGDMSSANDTDSLSNMLATLENLDSFFTKDSLDFPDSYAYGHQYNSSVDTRSTVATSADNWTLDDSPIVSPPAQFERLQAPLSLETRVPLGG